MYRLSFSSKLIVSKFAALCYALVISTLSQVNVVIAEETAMNEEAIIAVLSGNTIKGSGFSQIFFAPKKGWPAGTTYDDGGNLTFGKWEVRGGQYCSLWPPSPTWACYTMVQWSQNSKKWVAWIDENNRRFEGFVDQ